MKNEDNKTIVVYIDIMGFSQFVIDNPLQKSIDMLEMFNKTAGVGKKILAVFDRDIKTREDVYKNITYSLLSDSIILSVKYFDDDDTFDLKLHLLLQYLAHFQSEMFEKNLPLRGGIAVGQFYYKDNIMVGNALVKAVGLEKCAKFPRILLDDEICKRLTKRTEYLVSKDDDGFTYLDIFKFYKSSREAFYDFRYNKDNPDQIRVKESYDKFLSNVLKYITRSLEEDNFRIRDKQRWVIKKFTDVFTDVKITGSSGLSI
jgi:hypothetical protein